VFNKVVSSCIGGYDKLLDLLFLGSTERLVQAHLILEILDSMFRPRDVLPSDIETINVLLSMSVRSKNILLSISIIIKKVFLSMGIGPRNAWLNIDFEPK